MASKKRAAAQRGNRKLAGIQIPAAGSLDKRRRPVQLMFEERARLIADRGGEELLSTAEIRHLESAAYLNVLLEAQVYGALDGKPFDLTAYATAVNARNRCLQAVGLKRVPRDVTSLGDILRGAA